MILSSSHPPPIFVTVSLRFILIISLHHHLSVEASVGLVLFSAVCTCTKMLTFRRKIHLPSSGLMININRREYLICRTRAVCQLFPPDFCRDFFSSVQTVSPSLFKFLCFNPYHYHVTCINHEN